MLIIKGKINAYSSRLNGTAQVVKYPKTVSFFDFIWFDGTPWIIRLNAQKEATVPKTWQIQKMYAYNEWTLNILVKHKYSAIKFGNRGKLKLAKVHKKKKIL